MRPPPQQAVADDVSRALKEDLGDGDCTAALIPEKKTLQTRVICRETAVLSGQPWFEETFRQLQAHVTISWRLNDGESMEQDQEICQLRGLARPILAIMPPIMVDPS